MSEEAFEDFTCRMLLVCSWRVFGWSLGRGGQAGRVEKQDGAFLLVIFPAEDNEGKHFHFKSIVWRKSAVSKEETEGATGESVVNQQEWMVFTKSSDRNPA